MIASVGIFTAFILSFTFQEEVIAKPIEDKLTEQFDCLVLGHECIDIKKEEIFIQFEKDFSTLFANTFAIDVLIHDYTNENSVNPCIFSNSSFNNSLDRHSLKIQKYIREFFFKHILLYYNEVAYTMLFIIGEQYENSNFLTKSEFNERFRETVNIDKYKEIETQYFMLIDAFVLEAMDFSKFIFQAEQMFFEQTKIPVKTLREMLYLNREFIFNIDDDELIVDFYVGCNQVTKYYDYSSLRVEEEEEEEFIRKDYPGLYTGFKDQDIFLKTLIKYYFEFLDEKKIHEVGAVRKDYIKNKKQRFFAYDMAFNSRRYLIDSGSSSFQCNAHRSIIDCFETNILTTCGFIHNVDSMIDSEEDPKVICKRFLKKKNKQENEYCVALTENDQIH
ncbi:hypothetical protein CDIK_2718 [Cucumispora dikerogammari]|nr:hypothetical protein CDIK_2718 [Cucumispora dikerogammari]